MDKKRSAEYRLEPINSTREGNELVLTESQLKTSRFDMFSCIAIQYAATLPPLSVALYASLITAAGGSSFYFWGYLGGFVGQMFMALSLAEISSCFPHSSGKST